MQGKKNSTVSLWCEKRLKTWNHCRQDIDDMFIYIYKPASLFCFVDVSPWCIGKFQCIYVYI